MRADPGRFRQVHHRAFTLIELPAMSRRAFTLVELPAVSKRAFTLVELLVVISIIALLIGVLLPVLGQSKREARRVICATQMDQITQATLTYAVDYKGLMPIAARRLSDTANYAWDDEISEYIGMQLSQVEKDHTIPAEKAHKVLLCPEDEWSLKRTYAMYGSASQGTTPAPGYAQSGTSVGIGVRLTFPTAAAYPERYRLNLDKHVDAPAGTGVYWELPYGIENANPNQAGDYRRGMFTSGNDHFNARRLHRDIYNYAFADGHVKAFRPEDTLGPTGTTSSPKGMWTRNARD